MWQLAFSPQVLFPNKVQMFCSALNEEKMSSKLKEPSFSHQMTDICKLVPEHIGAYSECTIISFIAPKPARHTLNRT